MIEDSFIQAYTKQRFIYVFTKNLFLDILRLEKNYKWTYA